MQRMSDLIPLLRNGRCEGFKAGVHGVAMGTAALCAAYNLAAWLVRRKRHSAVNAGIYTALVIWEYVHIQHHVRCRPVTARRRVPEESTAA
jgi:hypothetical protein